MGQVQDLQRLLDFYFSDENLGKDRFLRAQIETSEQDGFIPLSLLLTFNKIKALKGSQTSLTEAIRTSDRLELNEDASMVRLKGRHLPSIPGDTDDRTVYLVRLSHIQ